MGYHGILWASMGIKEIISMFHLCSNEMVHKPGSVNLL